jgi:Flp pilus assembly protein TadG
MFAVFGAVAFVIDVGYGFNVQRKLQATADAAALAGADGLPNTSAAVSDAAEYGSQPGAKNALDVHGDVNETIATRCLSTFAGCTTANAVVVNETAHVNTFFARVLGIGSYTVHVKSTACSPCGGSRPLDIVVLLDRTGSMCMDHNGRSDPSCTDLNAARNGIFTFLKLLDPAEDRVALAVLPPAPTLGQACTKPSNGWTVYDNQSSPYVLVPLSSDYATSPGTLNQSSNFVQTLDCVQGFGTTAYAKALEAAQAELAAHGRPGVQKVILFFSDGAANTGPAWLPLSSPYRQTPCHQGVTSAGAIKASGTLIYSMGYDLDAENGGANVCDADNIPGNQNHTIHQYGPAESPPITAYQALQEIASSPAQFYNQPSATDLSSVFTQVGNDILSGAARLIDNNTQ